MTSKYRELVSGYEVDDQAFISAVISEIGGEQTNKNIDSEKIEPALEILNEALLLKANLGGAIKRKIPEALILMLPK